MSVKFTCDEATCQYHRVGLRGTFDGYMHIPPRGWLSFPLSDFEVHGCCRDHYERALASGDGRTPITADQGIPLDL